MSRSVLIIAETFGRGDDELGRLLMKNFIYSLARNAELPEAVMLANGGVRLACEGSDSLDDLRLLVESGVAVRSCGTCLDLYGLKDSLAVGEVGTMSGTVEALLGESEIVTIG
jgi:selenium metabolism protein YedF